MILSLLIALRWVYLALIAKMHFFLCNTSTWLSGLFCFSMLDLLMLWLNCTIQINDSIFFQLKPLLIICLFNSFHFQERPKWLDVKTVNELKTKIGHVIVMLLLIGLFDKSKKAIIQSPVDLLCFSASVLLSSGSLFLLSKLNDSN